MGTSSIFYGNNDRSALLPSDYEGSEENIVSVSWQTVKTDMSKFITSGGTKGSGRHIIKQYIKATGGAGKMMNQSSAGLKTARSIGSMLYNISTDGIGVTLDNLGIQFQGKSVSEIFSRLLDVMSPGVNTKEEAAAREAAQETLVDLYEYVEENDMNLECLDHMEPYLMDKAMCKYISSYIWNMMLKDLESRFEKYMDDAANTCQMEKDFKDIISSVVKIEFEKKGSLMNNNVTEAISDLSTKCIKALEGME